MQIINNAINAQALAEKSRQEYAATLYASAALAHITIIMAVDAMDEMESKCPQIIHHKIKWAFNEVYKDVKKLNTAINAQMIGDKEAAWMADFGNCAYSAIEPHIQRLHNAVSNFLGRYPKIKDRQTFASVVIAQSLASEAKTYVDHAARKFIQYNVTVKDGRKVSAQAVVQSLSCAALRHHLTVIADCLLSPCLPNDANILDDPAVNCGCKAVINCLIDPKTWAAAREKSEKINNLN